MLNFVKKHSRLVMPLAVCLYLLATAPAWSQPLQIVTEEFPPYNYTKNDQVTGMSTEVVLAVLAAMNLSAEIKVYPWARAYAMALNKKDILIFSMARSPKRENLFQWAGPVAPVQSCLFALKTRPDIQFNNLEEAQKYHIITQLKGRTAQALMQKGFSESQNLFLITSAERAFIMLQTGRGDLLGYPELVMYHVIRQSDMAPEEAVRKVYCFEKVSALYAAFNLKTSRDMVNRFQAALDTIKANGTYQKILEKYLNPN